MCKTGNQKGFSVTEFVILSALLMILGFALMGGMFNAIDTAKQKKSMANLQEWTTALNAYYSDYNFYPKSNPLWNVPVGPGEIVYETLRQKRYLDNPIFLDGWNYNLWYGASIPMAQKYTMSSFGKGHTSDAAAVIYFRCFQCDIIISNGVFIAQPAHARQEDSANGIDCPQSECQ